MKTRGIILMSITAAIVIAASSITFNSFSYTAGSPEACTGSPGDKGTCAKPECHKGTASAKAGLITSTVPASGYVAGQVYTITAKVSGAATAKKFGFQVSPQNASGKLLGTLAVVNATETKLTNKGKYICHKEPGTDGKGSKTWTFKWTAPAAGSGKVTFYGCFLIGGKPETIYSSKLEVKEAT